MQPPPFLSNAPMQGDPPCGWDDFLSPQLRRFPRASTKIRLRKVLGYGIEGCVAQVRLDHDASPFALKIFFDSVPNEDGWWPLEREARTVAVLEKIQTGLRQSAPKPVHVPAKRTSRLDCLRCLYAFSADGRRSRVFDSLPPRGKVAVPDSSTRLRQCLGWTRVRGADFMAMNDVIEVDDNAADRGEGSASYIDRSREYFAIAYEYIPDTKLERDAVQRQLDFFYRIGFHPCQAVKEENWQGPGVLLDFGDYNAPVDPWFKALSSYHPCRSAEILIDRAAVEARAEEEEIRMRELEDQGIGPTEEEKRAQEKERVTAKTARYIEWGYQDKWHRSYFDLSKEEILDYKLEQDPLADVHIPAVEPRAVIKAWNAYKKQKKEYLAQAS